MQRNKKTERYNEFVVKYTIVYHGNKVKMEMQVSQEYIRSVIRILNT